MIRRFTLSVMLALAVSGNAFADSATLLPATPANVHLALFFDYQLGPAATSTSEGAFQREAGHDDLVFGAQSSAPGQNHVVSGVPHLYYYSWRLDGGASQGPGLGPFLNSHPDWIVYKNDRRTPAWGGGSPQADLNRAPLDVTNPAVQQYMMDAFIRPAITQGGYNGVGFDVATTVNSDHRAGVYRTVGALMAGAAAGSSTVQASTPVPAGTSIAFGSASNMEYETVAAASGATLTLAAPLQYSHAAGEWLGEWKQQYSGQKLDAAYRQATITAFQQVVQLIKQANPNAIVGINDIMDLWDPGADQNGAHAWEYWRDLVPYADLVLDEAGFTNTANTPPYITDAPSKNGVADPFALKVKDYQWAESQGKGLMIVDYEPYQVTSGMTTGDPQARFDVQWAIATYLIARGDHTYLVWRGHRQTPGELYQEPEFAAAAVGAPTDTPYQSQGVWMRDYSNGLAIANPSAANAVTVSLPSVTYIDLYGNPASTTTLQPHSGLVLLKSAASALTPIPSPTPTATSTATPTPSPTPVPLSFTRKIAVAGGAKQFVTVHAAPHTAVHIRVSYPNGMHQSHGGATNASGVLKYDYVQPASRITRTGQMATIVVRSAESSVSKTYHILFARIDVVVSPTATSVGHRVTIWVHTRAHAAVIVRVVSPDGAYDTLRGTTSVHGWAQLRYTVGRKLARGGATELHILAQTASSPIVATKINLTITG